MTMKPNPMVILTGPDGSREDSTFHCTGKKNKRSYYICRFHAGI